MTTSPETAITAKEFLHAIETPQEEMAGQASLTLPRDPELMKLAAESGCVSLFMGMESLSAGKSAIPEQIL